MRIKRFGSLQVELWKKYIGFEKSNPLRSEDTALVTRRVMFATEQCLLVLTHHPAVWHQAAQYLDQSSKLLTEKGVRILHSFRHTASCRAQTVTGNSLSVKSVWRKASLNKSNNSISQNAVVSQIYFIDPKKR